MLHIQAFLKNLKDMGKTGTKENEVPIIVSEHGHTKTVKNKNE